MSGNLQFDARQVAPDVGYEVLPAGWYKVVVSESEIKPTKDGSGLMLVTVYTVIDGQYTKRKVFGRFNIKNNNPQAQEIAYKQLSALAHAVGVLQVADSSQLHNIPLQIKLKIKPADGKFDESNDIVSWKNINEQVGAVAATQAPAFAAPPIPPAQVQQYAPPVQAQQPPAAAQWAPPAGQVQPAAAPAPTQAPAWAPPAGQQPWQPPQAQVAPLQTAPVQTAPTQPQGVPAAQAAPPPWAQPQQ